jgi:hypothetical protein
MPSQHTCNVNSKAAEGYLTVYPELSPSPMQHHLVDHISSHLLPCHAGAQKDTGFLEPATSCCKFRAPCEDWTSQRPHHTLKAHHIHCMPAVHLMLSKRPQQHPNHWKRCKHHKTPVTLKDHYRHTSGRPWEASLSQQDRGV